MDVAKQPDQLPDWTRTSKEVRIAISSALKTRIDSGWSIRKRTTEKVGKGRVSKKMKETEGTMLTRALIDTINSAAVVVQSDPTHALVTDDEWDDPWVFKFLPLSIYLSVLCKYLSIFIYFIC
jgi:hypothetical protein